MSAPRRQRGASTISNIFWLAVLAAGAYALWNVVPVFYDHYNLADKVLEVSRMHPGVPGNKDDDLKEKIMKYVRETRMDPYVYPQNIRLNTRESSRLITVEYTREALVLPGFKHIFTRRIEVDSPFY